MGYRDVPVATVTCPGCSAEVPADAELCPACGNPVDIARFAELELKVKPDLKKARTFLGVLTGLCAVGLALAAASERRSAIIASGFGVVVFGACFLVAFRRPLGASIAAMAVFLFNQALL